MENSKCFIRTKEYMRREIERIEVDLKDGKGIIFLT